MTSGWSHCLRKARAWFLCPISVRPSSGRRAKSSSAPINAQGVGPKVIEKDRETSLRPSDLDEPAENAFRAARPRYIGAVAAPGSVAGSPRRATNASA